ncbi:MAG: methenyltetrahydromethanopterin cyclohydrolase, partial [Pseudomonadota bacterium]
MKQPSLNAQVAPLVRDLIDNADALRVGVSKGSLGETLIDCGVDAVGGLEVGRRLAEICLA